MSTSFPANNFVWPNYRGEPNPVVLVLERASRTQQLTLRAITYEDGYAEAWGTASVIPHDGVHADLCSEPDTLYIKNYGCNEGVLDALIAQGYAEKTGAVAWPSTSFASFCQVKLTEKGRALNPELFVPA